MLIIHGFSRLHDARAMEPDETNGETILDQEPPVCVCVRFVIVYPHSNLSGSFVRPSREISNMFHVTDLPNVT